MALLGWIWAAFIGPICRGLKPKLRPQKLNTLEELDLSVLKA